MADDLSASVGQSGAAHPLLVLTSALESMAGGVAAAGTPVLVVHLADGADAVVVRTTGALAAWRPARPVADQVANGAPISYAKFLSWRGQLQPEPPRRPEPAHVSSTAAHRNEDWKFGFVGSRDRSSGRPSTCRRRGCRWTAVPSTTWSPWPWRRPRAPSSRAPSTGWRTPPARPSSSPWSTSTGAAATRSSSTDHRTPDEIRAGSRVEMTFRRLFSADGIHDYFWKGRPVRTGVGGEADAEADADADADRGGGA